MASSAGSGKDTVADYLSDILCMSKNNLHVAKVSLGDPIHRICEEMNEGGKVTRTQLQEFGESMRDIFGENIWINKADSIIGNFKESFSNAVAIVPDVRKLTEFAHYVVELDYLPIYVLVDKKIAHKRLFQRDGAYNSKDLLKEIETQLNFIENLPTEEVKVGRKISKLKKVSLDKSGIFNNIYIVNNNGSFDELKTQLNEWVKINNEKLYT